MPSILASLLLGLLVYGANAAHTPSPKQLGDITLLAQNNLRSKPSHTLHCSVLGPTAAGLTELCKESRANIVRSK